MARDRDFTLVNESGCAIESVYVNLPGDSVFDENEACVWSMKVDWADGRAPSFFTRLDLCNIGNVYLRYDEATDGRYVVHDRLNLSGYRRPC